MIAIPRKIKVGPYQFQIKTDPASIARKSHEEGEYLYGCFNFRDLEIVVDAETDLTHQQDTLLHELEHVINRVASIPAQIDMMEESLVTRTTPWRLQVLQDNPCLIAFLMQQKGGAE